jgi:DNA repair exonuclease SbcCD ATPase subunit
LNFNSLTITNFMGIGKASLNFTRGLHLVVGVNNDMPNEGESNGAAKSSIFEAIGWCLFDYTPRTEWKADDAVNRVVGKDCLVRVELAHEGKVVVVQRARKHTTEKNGWRVWVDGEERTQHTAKNTKQVIASVLPVSDRVFRYGIMVGQNMPHRFLDLPESGKMQLLTDVLDLTMYDRAAERISEVLSGLSVDSGRTLTAYEALTTQEQIAVQKVEEAKVALQAFDQQPKPTIEGAEPPEDLSGILQRTKLQADEAQAKVQGCRESVEEVRAAINNIRNNKASLATKLAVERQSINQQQSSMDNLNKLGGTQCPTCLQDVDPMVLIDPLTVMASKLFEGQQALSAVETEASDLDRQLDQHTVRFQELTKELQGWEAKLRNSEQAINTIHVKQAQAAQQAAALARLESDHAGKRAYLQATLDSAQTILDNVQQSLPAAKEAYETARNLTAHWSWWKQQNPRLRAAAIGEVLSYLNQRTEAYMDVISGGAIGVRLYQEAYGQGSRIRVELRTPSGKYGTSSGGEKRRVDLGLYLAISDLLRRSAGVKCNLTVCDEITDSLSPQGIQSVLSLLRQRAQDGCVYVITHNPAVLASTTFDSVVTATKVGGVSTVTEQI